MGIEESGLILRANSSETLFFRIEGHIMMSLLDTLEVVSGDLR